MPRRPNPHHNEIVTDNRSIEEIANEYNLSSMQIYRIKNKGLIENNVINNVKDNVNDNVKNIKKPRDPPARKNLQGNNYSQDDIEFLKALIIKCTSRRVISQPESLRAMNIVSKL